jgi:hypothetical protein
LYVAAPPALNPAFVVTELWQSHGRSFAEIRSMTQEELSSTLLRHGSEAATFREMVQFADLLETRPLVKLLEELPGLAHLSPSKFQLASQVLRKRFKLTANVEKQQLVTFAGEIADGIDDGETSMRVRSIFGSE